MSWGDPSEFGSCGGRVYIYIYIEKDRETSDYACLYVALGHLFSLHTHKCKHVYVLSVYKLLVVLQCGIPMPWKTRQGQSERPKSSWKLEPFLMMAAGNLESYRKKDREQVTHPYCIDN